MTFFGEADVEADDLLTSLPGEEKVTVTPKEALEWEKELVGVYVSSHPLQQMTVDLASEITHNTSEITETLVDSQVTIGGMITDVRQITTKKGDSMAFVRLEDLLGTIDVTVFPGLYRDHRALWMIDKIVLIRGKVDSRAGRVSVVADSVQDHIEAARRIDDQTSVEYRYRNGNAQAERPRLSEKHAARFVPPPITVTSSGVEDDDSAYLGEEDPFAKVAPDWMEDEGVSPSPVAVPVERPSEETTLAHPGQADVDSGNSHQRDAGTTPLAAQTIRITFRRARALEADRRKLADLVQALSQFDGEDRFEIVVEAHGIARYRLDFPNNRTRVCPELESELMQRLGPGGWMVDGTS